MLKIEKIVNEGVPVNNTFTCIACATNNNKNTYSIRLFNPYLDNRIPLCSECIKRLKLEIEFLEASNELEDMGDEGHN